MILDGPNCLSKNLKKLQVRARKKNAKTGPFLLEKILGRKKVKIKAWKCQNMNKRSIFKSWKKQNKNELRTGKTRILSLFILISRKVKNCQMKMTIFWSPNENAWDNRMRRPISETFCITREYSRVSTWTFKIRPCLRTKFSCRIKINDVRAWKREPMIRHIDNQDSFIDNNARLLWALKDWRARTSETGLF